MALPVAAGGQGVDGHDLVAGRHQGADEEPPVGLGAHHDGGGVSGVLGHQGVERRDAPEVVGNPPPRQHPAGLVLDAEVVVGLGPIVADEDHVLLLRSTVRHEPEEVGGALMA